MKLLFTILLLAASFNGLSQMKDPVKWSYESRQTGAHEYELVFKAVLDKGWHVWSTDPGGDGSLIPPSFTIEKNSGIAGNNKVKEEGTLISTAFEGIDGKVNYYEGSVTYTLPVKILRSGKITVKGTHEYQLCNEQMCLPPKRRPFTFTVGN